jgi:hypothetical protein
MAADRFFSFSGPRLLFYDPARLLSNECADLLRSAGTGAEEEEAFCLAGRLISGLVKAVNGLISIIRRGCVFCFNGRGNFFSLGERANGGAGDARNVYEDARNLYRDAWNVCRDVLNLYRDALNVCGDALNVSGDALNVYEDAWNVSGDALNVCGDARNVSRDALNVSGDALNVCRDALNVSGDARNVSRDVLNLSRDVLWMSLAAI